ncbi:SapC family protein [Sphingomonas sp. PB4P5]|uniref:SapC family protein n=1 Tax=Parasphingomonas puruogangriensis TaxID=3096155 RepID=UPI002FC5C328
MTGTVPLNATRHHALRVDAMAGAAARQFVQIGLSEIALAAADMPLCLAKDAQTGRFNLIALFGLVEPRNLFWRNDHLHATYLPRAASLTGFRLHDAGLVGLALDEGDASLGTRGPALFATDHSPLPILTDIRAALDTLVADIAAAQALIDGYARHRLIRPLSLLLRHDDGQEHAVAGLYGLDEEALATLDDATVIAMHRADQLAPAAVMAASLAQVERLRQLHNGSHPRTIASYSLTLGD